MTASKNIDKQRQLNNVESDKSEKNMLIDKKLAISNDNSKAPESISILRREEVCAQVHATQQEPQFFLI